VASHLSICVVMTMVYVCGKDRSLMSAVVKLKGI
jgi:hypothetical protein